MRPVPTREARGQKTWTGIGAVSRDRQFRHAHRLGPFLLLGALAAIAL